jgi:uncharacterized membrane protein
MRDRIQIKEIAKFQFQQRLGMSIGAAFLYGLLAISQNFTYRIDSDNPLFGSGLMYVFTIIAIVFWLAYIFIGTAVSVGYAQFTRRIYCNEITSVGDMFDTGFRNYWRNIGGMLWMKLFIFLWSLLFIIPGIIKYYAYYLTPYILAEYPNVPATEALKLSMRMTDGYKGEIFIMSLSFLGWFLLSALTIGILGIVYVNPYYYTSMAGMYVSLRDNALASGRVKYEELTYQYGTANYQ